MIDDHDVRLGGALPHLRDVAVMELRTIRTDAVLGAGRDVVPERQVFRQILDFGAVTGVGRLTPGLDQLDVMRLIG